jgi:CMP-N,N'-diacetyllegionaminic acid synthase
VYRGNSFLAIIPARGGSKGIPKKNIIKVNGKPLIAYTIEPALQSKYIDRVIVSTDDEEIALISKECGADVPFLRPATLATDKAKTIDVLIHMIENLAKEYDYVILLQPTQPLRTVQQIDAAIEQVINEGQTSLVSVKSVTEHPILMRTIDIDGRLQSISEESSSVRRQEFQQVYLVDGSIYINKTEELTLLTSLNDNIYPFIIDYSIDIDTINDLKKFREEIN